MIKQLGVQVVCDICGVESDPVPAKETSWISAPSPPNWRRFQVVTSIGRGGITRVMDVCPTCKTPFDPYLPGDAEES